MSAGAAPDQAHESLAAAARAGIHRLAVPTPFLVGRINCYLIEDEPLTLIDTGPNSGKSLDELEQMLAARGHAVEDLELIVITHQHMDHLGLLEILVRRSGARVAALDQLAPYLERFSESAAADDAYAQEIMRRHGVPTDVISVLGSVGAAFRSFGSSAHVTDPLAPGQDLQLRDRRLRVIHSPGHSPSDTQFWDAERRVLLSGDHLLGRISSNPLVTRPLNGDTSQRPHALVRLIESMRATRELPAELVLPGHGDPVTEPVALIDERLRMHERRARKILGILGDDALTAYEVAVEMWGNIAVTQAYLTLSEVLGHMDLLTADARAEEVQDGSIARFRATRAAGHAD